MLVGVGPILIAVLAGLLLHEGFPRSLFAGVGVAFAGIVVIAIASSTHTATTTGVLLCLAAAGAYAAGVIAQKIVLRRLTPVQTVFSCAVIGAVACAPFAPQLVHQLGPAHGGSTGWIAYLGIGPTALGFITWGFALSRTTQAASRRRRTSSRRSRCSSAGRGSTSRRQRSPTSAARCASPASRCQGGPVSDTEKVSDTGVLTTPSATGRRAPAAAGTGSRS